VEHLVVEFGEDGKLLEPLDGDVGAPAVVAGLDALLLAPEQTRVEGH